MRLEFPVLFFLLICFDAIKCIDNETDVVNEDGQFRVRVPVQRLHSRHRRYMAPGARWDALVGWETLTDIFDIHSYIQIRYYMDYLFGGQTAYNALIEANNAANSAFVATKAAVLAGQAVPTVTGRRAKQVNLADCQCSWGGLTSCDTCMPGGYVGPTGVPAGAPTGLTPGKRRRRNSGEDIFPFKIEGNVNNILVRSLADDQVEILQRIEEGLNRTGLNGRQCLLRAVCELSETPIHEHSLLGETISLLFKPKDESHLKLSDFIRAEQIGAEHGDCWSVYNGCSYSIFSFLPGLNPTGDEAQVEFIFDKVETGTKVSQTNFDDEEAKNGKLFQKNIFDDLKTFNKHDFKHVINS